MDSNLNLEPTLPTFQPVDTDATTQDDDEMLVIRDPATRADLERNVLASFHKVEDLLIAHGTRQNDMDDDLDEVVKQDPVKVEPLKLENCVSGGDGRLTHLKATPDTNHAEIVRFRIREILARDTYINSAADYYGIALEDRIKDLTIRDVDVVQFKIRKSELVNWLACHAGAVGSKLVHSKKHPNKNGLITWTYLCQCHGSKQDRKDRKPGGKSGKIRDVRKGTIKSHCPARILATEELEGIKEKSLSIKLYYHHNHALACLENIVTAQKSERIKATIKSLLLQGSPIRNVMERLTIDYDRFMAIVRGNGQRLSRDDFVTYEDVYNIWHKIYTTTMRKDADATLSAMKWLEEIEGKGGFVFYNWKNTAKGVFYGFATEWQLRQLRDHGQSLCFDRAHNVFGPNTNLFTLVLKNKDHGFGVPVAFLLTRSTDSSILTAWLRALCEKMKQMFSTPAGTTPTGEPTPAREYNYKPNAIITDQGNTEVLAIKTAFPGTPILYCAWHVWKAWEREIRSRMTGMERLTIKEKKDLREKVRLDLRAILYEKDKAVALGLLARFRVRWKKQKNLLEYLNKNYFGGDPLANQNDDNQEEEDVSISDGDADDDVPEDENSTSAIPVPEGPAIIAIEGAPLTPRQLREYAIARKQERWMLCYRQELSYASIDTNNYIESWHNTLKQPFFRDKQQRRVDTVIHVLNAMAVPHYQQKCMWSLVNVDRIDAVQRDEAKHLQRVKDLLKARVDKGQLPPTLYQLTTDVVRVESFTTPGEFYEIKIDFTRVSAGHIVSCGCPAFQKEETCCKHISLLQLEIPLLKFLKIDREDIHNDLDLLALAPEADHDQWALQPSAQLPGLGLQYYIDRIISLNALRDKEKTLPRESELCVQLERFLTDFEAIFPRKEGQDLSYKRQRQTY